MRAIFIYRNAPESILGGGEPAFAARVFQHVVGSGRADLMSAADRLGLIAPPPSGEDGYVYPTGTASSVSWRVTHTHTYPESLRLWPDEVHARLNVDNRQCTCRTRV